MKALSSPRSFKGLTERCGVIRGLNPQNTRLTLWINCHTGFGNTRDGSCRGDDWLPCHECDTNGCIQPGHHQGPTDHMASPAALDHGPTVCWHGCWLRNQDTSTFFSTERWSFKGAEVRSHASSESMKRLLRQRVWRGTHVVLPIIPFRIPKAIEIRSVGCLRSRGQT